MRRTPWLAAYAVLAYAFLHVPMLILGVFSFNASRYSMWTGFSLEWYKATFRDTQLAGAAWNSLVIEPSGPGGDQLGRTA